jgi:glutamate 5-kinase
MPGTAVRQDVIRAARRIVVKVGTNSICDDDGRLKRRAISALARQVAQLREDKRAVTLVVSGAIGAGMGELQLPRRPRTMPKLQAAAAVGQGQLMRTFHDVFAKRGLRVGQVLVTRSDFEDRTRYLNIRNTLRSLEELGAVAIINENDTVAVDEIRFGENDVLAAMVTNMLRADLLVLLTNVPGVLCGGDVLDVIEEVDDGVRALVTRSRSRHGSGGMASKLTAAGMVTEAGEAAIIAAADEPNVLTKIMAGKTIGTVFVPAAEKMSSRRRWIGQVSRAAGRIAIDPGAERALRKRGKSLLPSGITSVSGTFHKGDTIIIEDADGREIARGLTNYDAAQIERIKGLRSAQIAPALGDKPYDEVVHRDNMTLTAAGG